MPKTTDKKPSKASARRKPIPVDTGSGRFSVASKLQHLSRKLSAKRKQYMVRRPHRSFKRTHARDYRRSLTMPGYVSFTVIVFREIIGHWRTFASLALVYVVIVAVLGGVTNQDTYTEIGSLIKESSSALDSNGLGKVGQATLLLVSAFATGPTGLSADQQVYLAIALLFVWLSSVWLLREYKLGRKPRMRDALYSSGSPLISTLIVLIVLLLQLLPIGIIALVYSALTSVGILDGGFSAMLFWVVAVLVFTLVMYWIVSTLVALVVVTLPGMYPMQAIKAAGDLVIGRRLRIMYRMLWGFGVAVLSWAVVMVPLVMFDTWLKDLWPAVEAVPIMPIAAAAAGSLVTIWISSYTYLLYRKVVDDAAPPA